MSRFLSSGTCAVLILAFIAATVPFGRANASFPDVPSTHVYADAIAYVQAEGLMTGQENGFFAPDQRLNRAEFATVLVRKKQSDSKTGLCIANVQQRGLIKRFFPDVQLDAWFANYVCSAKQLKIVQGYSDGTFRPNQTINIAEAVTMLARLHGLASDESADPWYQASYDALAERNAIPPTGRDPNHAVTRGEFAFMLQNVISSEQQEVLENMPVGTKTALDIAYGSDAKQRLDVYYDSGASDVPVMFLLHGGGWVTGSKEETRNLATYFREQGYLVVSADYRLTTETKNAYPVAVEDAACALAWVKKHAAEYGGDASRVVVLGHSAGAHIGALVSYNPEGDWTANCTVKGESLEVAGYIGSGGVYDFDSIIKGHGNPMKMFLGNLYGVGKWEEAEPINYVSSGDPPSLIAVGSEDMSVLTSTAFHTALVDAGVPATLKIFEGFAHPDFVKKLPTDASLQKIVRDFLADIVQ